MIQCLFFHVWHHYSTLCVRSSILCIAQRSFFFIGVLCSTLWPYHGLFIHSAFYGHVNCFQSLDIITKTAMTFLCMSWWIYVCISIAHITRSGLGGPQGRRLFSIYRYYKVVFQNIFTNLTLTSNVWNFQLLCILADSWYILSFLS